MHSVKESSSLVNHSEMTRAEYIEVFLKEIERLKPRLDCDRTHAIALDYDSLCLLLSVGDCRAKVFVEHLNPDPAKAAKEAFETWRLTRARGNFEIEE